MTSLPDRLHVLFEIGDAFKAGDPLSEWAVTVAMAANDLATVNAWLAEDDPLGRRHGYLYRVGIAHFFEIGENLRKREESDAAVADFIASMGEEADGYRAALGTHRRLYSELARIRNLTAFHYPASKDARSRLTGALKDASDSNGVVSLGTDPRWRRFEFADEVMAALFTKCAGGEDAMPALFHDVSTAIMAFDEFAHLAIAEFVVRSGTPYRRVEPADTNDLQAGWIPVADA